MTDSRNVVGFYGSKKKEKQAGVAISRCFPACTRELVVHRKMARRWHSNKAANPISTPSLRREGIVREIYVGTSLKHRAESLKLVLEAAKSWTLTWVLHLHVSSVRK